jgi:hypothetical protein
MMANLFSDGSPSVSGSLSPCIARHFKEGERHYRNFEFFRHRKAKTCVGRAPEMEFQLYTGIYTVIREIFLSRQMALYVLSLI